MFSNAQIFENDNCGYNSSEFFKPWIGNNKFLDNYLKTEIADSLSYRIPVTFWIYKNDNKTGSSLVEVKNMMTDLNYFNAVNLTGFSFYVNDIIEINNSKRADLGYYIEAPFVSTFYKKRGNVNVHFSESLSENRLFNSKIYYKGTYNKINKSIILVKYNSRTGLSHEVGHFLGLKHPHKNFNRGKLKQESVSRTRTKLRFFRKVKNCEVTGDCLCDTPAEPQLSDYINKNCQFTGLDLTDNWGDFYNPDTDNIMSYPTYKVCRNKFTEGQIAVMLYTAEKSKYSDGWKVDSLNNKSKIYSFDNYEPDNYKEQATEIRTNEIQYHTFHNIYNGKIKRPNDNDIDWYSYSCKSDTLNSFSISIFKGEYPFSDVDLQIYNSLGELLFIKTYIKENEIIDVDNIQGKDFYLKISKSLNYEKYQLFDYIIEIK